MTSGGLGDIWRAPVLPLEGWQRWGQAWTTWFRARPRLALRLRQAAVLSIWVAIPLVLVALIFVPDIRESIAAWVGVLWMVAFWCVLSRTRTLGWSSIARVLTLSLPWRVLTGLAILNGLRVRSSH